MKIICLYISFSVFLFGCHAQQKEEEFKKNNTDNSLLWKISGNGLSKPSFLFGTFHLLCKSDVHFSEQLQHAVKYSNEIYMEMDMDDPATMLSGLFYMNMNNGKKLSDLYTEKEYKKIESYFNDSIHTPLVMFQKAKPYFLVAMLYPQMMPCKTVTGVEEELMRLAKDDKKEIKGLETMQFQASVFDSIPYEWQAKELLKNIDSIQVYKKEFEDMLSSYKKQEINIIGNMLNKSDAGSEQFEDILLDKRNKNWVSQLNIIMKKESIFVAVGAGHLIGEKGLISLLRSAGYIVEPLSN